MSCLVKDDEVLKVLPKVIVQKMDDAKVGPIPDHRLDS